MAGRSLHRILIIEDDPDIQQVMRLALEAIGGFEVEMSRSGEDALQKAARFAPDLVLLDVMMPGMDGPDTLAKLQSDPQTAPIPAIFVTAKVQPHDVRRYRELGVLDVIPKPFDPMQLSAIIGAIWNKYYG